MISDNQWRRGRIIVSQSETRDTLPLVVEMTSGGLLWISNPATVLTVVWAITLGHTAGQQWRVLHCIPGSFLS